MAPDRHHFSAEFITARRDFFITDSETPAEPYCDDGRFHYVAHEHEAYFDWLYVVKGRLTETINGNDYAFGPGDLLWVRDGDWHEGERRRPAVLQAVREERLAEVRHRLHAGG